jgi:hypothetical protein
VLDRGSSDFDGCDAQYITSRAVSSRLICRPNQLPIAAGPATHPGLSTQILQIASPDFCKIASTMGFEIRQLWSAPEINPYNKKAKSIPIFNPVNKYGRVFFFSYLGFFIAFWSW